MKIKTSLIALALIGLTISGCTTTEIKTTKDTDQKETKKEESKKADKPKQLKIGDSITIAGSDSSTQIKAKLVDYLPTPQVGEYDTATNGKKIVGVVLQLTNVGDTPYADAPSNGVTVITTDGQQSSSTIVSEGECSGGFASSVKIAPGDKAKGCVAVEVPADSKGQKVQFTLDSGFGPDTAQWSIR